MTDIRDRFFFDPKHEGIVGRGCRSRNRSFSVRNTLGASFVVTERRPYIAEVSPGAQGACLHPRASGTARYISPKPFADSFRFGIPIPEGAPTSARERACTSPIRYTPQAAGTQRTGSFPRAETAERWTASAGGEARQRTIRGQSQDLLVGQPGRACRIDAASARHCERRRCPPGFRFDPEKPDS